LRTFPVCARAQRLQSENAVATASFQPNFELADFACRNFPRKVKKKKAEERVKVVRKE